LIAEGAQGLQREENRIGNKWGKKGVIIKVPEIREKKFEILVIKRLPSPA